MNQDELINLPDLAFARYCEDRFWVTKGIYNPIEQWFFIRGINEIIERRKMIILFLESMYQTAHKKRFGAGGLTERLEQFWHYQIIQNTVIHNASNLTEDRV